MLDIFSSYLNPDEATIAAEAATVVLINQANPSLSSTTPTTTTTTTSAQDEFDNEEKILVMDSSSFDETKNFSLNQKKQVQDEEVVVQVEVEEEINPWWFLNPFSIFNIRKRLNLSASSSSSSKLSSSKQAQSKSQENNQTDKVEEGKKEEEAAVDKEEEKEEEVNIDDATTTSNPQELEQKVSQQNASDDEGISLPPRLDDLDLVTKKEIPKSTVESGSSNVSPAYKLIKEAFSEFQLFSKACE
jgi:septum formation inhibitor MinC